MNKKLLFSVLLLGGSVAAETDLIDPELNSYAEESVGFMQEAFYEGDKQNRKLAELFKTPFSQECKKECIDKNYFFCPSANGEEGRCCDSTENCPKVDFCSFNAPIDSIGLQYWACPHEPSMCGQDFVLVPNKDGSASKVNNKGTVSNFSRGALCRYKLIFPVEGGQFDLIKVSIKSIRRVTVYAIDTKKYSDKEAKETLLNDGQSIEVQYPKSLYLSIVTAATVEPGYFDISYQYVDRDPEEVYSSLTKEEKETYEKEYIYQEVEVPFVGTTFFWVVIGAAIFGVLVMVLLCVGLCLMKRKNDRIISKVTMLAENRKKEAEEFGAPVTPGEVVDGQAGPSSKPFFDNEDDGNMKMIKANMGKILTDDQQQDQFNRFMQMYNKQQETMKSQRQQQDAALKAQQQTNDDAKNSSKGFKSPMNVFGKKKSKDISAPPSRDGNDTRDPVNTSGANNNPPAASGNQSKRSAGMTSEKDGLIDDKVLAMKELLKRDVPGSDPMGFPPSRPMRGAAGFNAGNTGIGGNNRILGSGNTGLGGLGGARPGSLAPL